MNSRTIELKHPHALYIGGRWVKPSVSGEFEVLDCSTEEVAARVARAGAPLSSMSLAAKVATVPPPFRAGTTASTASDTDHPTLAPGSARSVACRNAPSSHTGTNGAAQRAGNSFIEARHRIDYDGVYVIQAGLAGQRPEGKPVTLGLWVDGKLVYSEQIVENGKFTNQQGFSAYGPPEFQIEMAEKAARGERPW